MTVYVVVSNYVCVDSGDYESRVDGVFESFEDAQRLMEQEIKDTRTDFKDYDTEEQEYTKGDMAWAIWETEQYMSHHCDITIHEQEVQ